MVPYGSSVSLFYAMWIRHGRGRIYESKERRKYHDEEPDGFLYRNRGVLSARLQPFVRRWKICRLGTEPVYEFRRDRLVGVCV